MPLPSTPAGTRQPLLLASRGPISLTPQAPLRLVSPAITTTRCSPRRRCVLAASRPRRRCAPSAQVPCAARSGCVAPCALAITAIMHPAVQRPGACRLCCTLAHSNARQHPTQSFCRHQPCFSRPSRTCAQTRLTRGRVPSGEPMLSCSHWSTRKARAYPCKGPAAGAALLHASCGARPVHLFPAQKRAAVTCDLQHRPLVTWISQRR